MSKSRITHLVNQIWKVRKAIEEIRQERKLGALEEELKSLLLSYEPEDEEDDFVDIGNNGQRLVIVDDISAKIYNRKGTLVADKKKARELLAHQTFNAIFKPGKPSLVLNINQVKY